MKRILYIILPLFLLAGTSQAQDIFVDDCTGSGSGTPGDPYCDIQTAIDNSSGGEVIRVQAGTYNQDVTFGVNGGSGYNVSIVGEAAPNRPVLQGTLASTGVSGVTSEWTDVAIKNLIIENNSYLVYWSETHGSGVDLDNVLFENVDFRTIGSWSGGGYPIWTHGLSATTVGSGGLSFSNVKFDNQASGTPNFFRANLAGSGPLSITNSNLTDASFNWDAGQGSSPPIDFIGNSINGGFVLLSRQSDVAVQGNAFSSDGWLFLNAPISTDVSQNSFSNRSIDPYAIAVTNTFGGGPSQKVQDVSIENNTFSNIQGRAVWFTAFDNPPTSSTLSGIEIKNNDLSGAGGAFPVTDFDVNSPTDIEATCNWWGSTDSGVIASNIEDGGSPISFMPFRVDGTDDDPGTSGFQPVAGSCTGGGGSCDFPTLGNDIVNNSNRTVENTMTDQEGIAEFQFSVLDNFTVTSITPSGGYTRTGNTWTFTGTGTPPMTVDFTLQAASPSGQASYFLIATDACSSPEPLTTNFDPVYDLELDVPTKFSFTGGYPNPFSGHTTVEFALPDGADVRLVVYDVMGRQVATLADGPRPSGVHSVAWNGTSDGGRQLASGLYLMRLQAGDLAVTRRVTLVR